MKHEKGERIIAMFEAAKGLMVLIAGFGLLTFLHKNVQKSVEEIILHLHLNPAKHYPRIFIDLAGNITDFQLWMFALFAALYSGLRLLEAYGLWYGLRWAEWMAVITGSIYVPLEIYELFSGGSLIKLATLMINIGIVLFMVFKLKSKKSTM